MCMYQGIYTTTLTAMILQILEKRHGYILTDGTNDAETSSITCRKMMYMLQQ